MIKNTTELFENINNLEAVILSRNNYEFIYPLIIVNQCNIIGNDSTLRGPLLICSDVIISNVNFSNCENIINIREGACVQFFNCTFIGNDNTAINMEPNSNSSISLTNCKFSNFSSCICINENNTLSSLHDCLFQFCCICINDVIKNSIINVHDIINNLNFSSRYTIFLKFEESFYIHDLYNFCFDLCENNNYARIYGKSDFSVFDTSSLYVNTLQELNYVLNICPNCTTIFLKEGNYDLSNSSNDNNNGITISTPVNLIGMYSTKFFNTSYNSVQYAIKVNAPNIRIENLNIDGTENYLLNQGILIENSEIVSIKHLNMFNLSDHGLYHSNTKNKQQLIIENCTFSHIKKNSAVYAIGDTFVCDSVFKNLSTAINCFENSKLTLRNNSFENLFCCIYNKEHSFNNVIQSNNTFKFVQNLII